MNPPDLPLSPASDPAFAVYGSSTRLSWAAILAGLVAALAAQAVLVMLGAGLGFALYNPSTSPTPIGDFAEGAMVIHGISAVVSLFLGGWIAGRFTPATSRVRGGLHGFLVWCAATIAGIAVVAAGAGWAVGDLSKVVGGGLAAAGQPAAAAVKHSASLAQEETRRTGQAVDSFVDEAAATRTPEAPRAEGIRAKRDLHNALVKLFDPRQSDKMADNKAAAIKVLEDEGGLQPPDAERLVNEWTETYTQLRAELATARDEAENKARAEAEDAAKSLTILSFCSFAALVLGAVAASFGGRHGAKAALRHEAVVPVAP